MSWPWSELGLPGPAGLAEIRRAYAQRLKTTRPEEDPEGFQRLHDAYRQASQFARASRKGVPPPKDETDLPQGGEGPNPPLEPPRPLREATPENPPPQEERGFPDWDFERLFAEGEAESLASYRQRLEALRQKNYARFAAQEPAWHGGPEEVGSSVLAAARGLELLWECGASVELWRRFLNSPLFLGVRANLDFVLLLEDFLERRPDLSPEVRKTVFLAYEFENGSRYPMYRRLYRLLGVRRRDQRRLARERSAWRNRWRSFPAWRRVGIVICFSILAAFLVVGLGLSFRDGCRDFVQRREAEQWRSLSLQWLEEDFGQPFVRPLAAHEEICAPEAEPSLYFWVRPDGKRTEHRPGYRTDYPHILLKREMEAFAQSQGLGLRFDSAGEGYQGNLGEAPGSYLFDLPLLGAGESITALGALLDELESRDWYRVLEDRYGRPLTYQIFLCHGELSFYDAVSTEDGFDADSARAMYENEVGAAFCRYILEESGLAAQHLGEGAYVLVNQGTVEIGGETFFWVAGLEREERRPRAHYFLSSGGRMLFCLPEGRQDGVEGIVDLYRSTPSHMELEGVGLVMIWDQIERG